MKRRTFFKKSGLFTTSALIFGADFKNYSKQNDTQPNVLWITCEDLSSHLGCYGDHYAMTPNLDHFASEGIRYKNAFATAPVCTPARSTIITGLFASSLGTQHLRGSVPLSPQIRCFTEYLREEGYYCSNNEKEDYNFKTPSTAWDESSHTAHWRRREPGQPFFSVFNLFMTHQSQTRYGKEKLKEINQKLSTKERHDPDKAPIPPYFPDTPIVRLNMAALYTQVILMDKRFKEILDQLKEDGLEEDTIVFFYSDHGDGLPRGKRWLHDSGIRVPLIIRFPNNFQHLAPEKPGSMSKELVSFVDFAPTVLNLASVPIPSSIQGRAFLGEKRMAPRKYIYAIRDRVDEVLEFSRSVRDERYHYIRNFFPHRPRMQRSFFSEITPIRQELRRLYAAGELNEDESWLMHPNKPPEELYDTTMDPHEMYNLADFPDHQEVLSRMRKSLYQWMITTGDTSLLPEPEMIARSKGGSPFDMAQDRASFAIEDILEVADLVGRGSSHLAELRVFLSHSDNAIRYWAATCLAALGKNAKPATGELQIALQDYSPSVRFTAAEALCNLGYEKDAVKIVADGLLEQDIRVKLYAAQVLVVLGEKSRPAIPQMKKVLKQVEGLKDHGWYLKEAISYLLSQLNY